MRAFTGCCVHDNLFQFPIYIVKKKPRKLNAELFANGKLFFFFFFKQLETNLLKFPFSVSS